MTKNTKIRELLIQGFETSIFFIMTPVNEYEEFRQMFND